MKKYLFIIGVGLPIALTSCQQRNAGTNVATVENAQFAGESLQNTATGDDWQWRGVNRDGIYHETGLLKEWSPNGPELLWYTEALGDGYSSPAIANGRIYITGLTRDRLMLYVFDLNGNLLAQKDVGREESRNYPGPRSSVVISDGKLYLYNAFGQIFCLDANTLNEIWTKNVISEFNGTNIEWGVCETPLIVGDKIFITPGGSANNFVALNKNTGALIWSSRGEGHESTYCSPKFIGNQSIPMIATITQQHIIGFHADTGEKLWSHPITNQWNIHPNTPVYGDGMIFVTTGYGGGSIMLRLTNGGRGIERAWTNNVDNQIGGAVKVGNYVYASGHNGSRGFHCVDWNTGEVKYRSTDIGNGTVIYADGMLYYYSDRGELALIRPNSERFEMVSRTSVTLGTNQHWAHLVIHDGVLYVRHGNALMAYKVR